MFSSKQSTKGTGRESVRKRKARKRQWDLTKTKIMK